MSKILVMGFFILFSLNIVGTLVCIYCRFVKPDNTCATQETTCYRGPMYYCYTQITSRGYGIVKVDRGCSAACRTIKYRKTQYEKAMLCCDKDRCNDHKIWTKGT